MIFCDWRHRSVALLYQHSHKQTRSSAEIRFQKLKVGTVKTFQVHQTPHTKNNKLSHQTLNSCQRCYIQY